MKNLLLDLVGKVEDVGYVVVAVVHDTGSTNLHICQDFDTDPVEKKKSLRNPDPDRKLFVLAEIEHLMKFIRNNFLDSDFFSVIETMFYIDTCISEMLIETKSAYGLAYKLNEMSLRVNG